MKKKALSLALSLLMVLSLLPVSALAAGGGTAFASTQNVEVDGQPVQFQMYALKDANGNPTNYVKLRDVAHVLNSTSAKFYVGWDGAITITTGTAYQDTGSEMTTPYSGDRAYRDGTQTVMVNGAGRQMNAIILTDDQGGDYTYFKLRDLGEALGFKVDWAEGRGVFIETAGASQPGDPAKPTVTYYQEYPDLPDFGAYYGVPLLEAFVDDEGAFDYEKSIIYIYDADQVESILNQGGDLDGYLNLLEASGYPLTDSFEDSDGFTTLVFQKENRQVMVGLSLLSNQVRFAIYVFELTAAPPAGTLAYYQDAPDVPDFGAYFGIRLEDSYVDYNGGGLYNKGTAYIYGAYDIGSLLDQGVDFVSGYASLLEANGYRYTDNFVSDDGYTTMVFEKGNRGVMFGLGDMTSGTKFLVMVIDH